MKNKKNILVISAMLLGLVLTGCNNGPKEPIFISTFSDVTTFDDPIDIHTDDQKAFVEFNDGYETLTSNQIKSNYHVDGNKSYSDPKSFTITWDQDEDESKVLKNYSIDLSKDENFSDYITYVGTKDKSLDLYNMEIGQKYYYRVVANYEDEVEPDYSYVYSFETEDVAPRNLKVHGMTNCRDMGGRTTVNGGRIKQGLLYRTAALDDNQSGSIITDEGKKVMLDILKVKTEIELRGGPNGTGGEASKTDGSRLGDSINFQYLPFAYSNGKNLLFRNIEPVLKTFDVLGDADNYPIFFHCRIGTDRTGLIGLLVNALLGVPLQEIYQDYLFSDFGSIGKTSTVGQNNEDSIAGYVAQLQAFPGEQLQNKVYNFLLTAGVPHEKLDTIIDVLTEGAKPVNEADKIHVDTVDGMLVEGTSLSRADAIRSPKVSVKFTGAGQKITYSFKTDRDFNATLFANLMSRSTSGTINGALKVTLDGNEITLKTTSFATNQLGFGDTADYWIPAELGNISVSSGRHKLVIEAKTSTALSISQIALQMSEAAKVVFNQISEAA